MEEAMRRMASGEARILVGTQMVTKGHDFPNVTLVVVLNADQGDYSWTVPERLNPAGTRIDYSGSSRGNISACTIPAPAACGFRSQDVALAELPCPVAELPEELAGLDDPVLSASSCHSMTLPRTT